MQKLDALDALRACEERFRNLIARNADAMLVVDQGGFVRFVNPAGEALLGRPASDLVGSQFGFPVMAGETTEVDVVGAGGRPSIAEMRVVETEWESTPALLAVLRDVTERKRAEEERVALAREQLARIEAEHALHERDEFLAVASHELKTPLSTLSATAQLLRRELDRRGGIEADHLRTALLRLDDQSRQLARLVSHLLDVADINAHRLMLVRRGVDLTDLVATVVAERQTTTTTHTLELRSTGHIEAFIDSTRIERVIASLLDNAIQYSPSGGTVEVELTNTSSMACVAVRDHGLGVPLERQAHLFERFNRAHADDYISGLGLALFISRQVVELHGGTIAAEFPPDGGSRFVVQLPLAQPARTSP